MLFSPSKTWAESNFQTIVLIGVKGLYSCRRGKINSLQRKNLHKNGFFAQSKLVIAFLGVNLWLVNNFFGSAKLRWICGFTTKAVPILLTVKMSGLKNGPLGRSSIVNFVWLHDLKHFLTTLVFQL